MSRETEEVIAESRDAIDKLRKLVRLLEAFSNDLSVIVQHQQQAESEPHNGE